MSDPADSVFSPSQAHSLTINKQPWCHSGVSEWQVDIDASTRHLPPSSIQNSALREQRTGYSQPPA